MKKTKIKNRDAQKKRTSHKAVESVLRPEERLWWERFVKKVGLENRDAQKKRTSHKAVESVLRPEERLWWERFLKKVGLEPGVKERGSYGW